MFSVFGSLTVLISLLILPIVLFALNLYKKYFRLVQLGGRFPGPLALPLIGNAHQFILRPSEKVLQIFIKCFEKYGSTLRLWFGPELSILISDLRDVEHVLSSAKFIEKSNHYKYLRSFLNDGLLISSGRKWSERRKLITPSFHFQMLEKFIEIYEKQSQVLLVKLSSLEPNKAFDFHEMITLYTLDVICETAMGVTVNAQTKSNSDYVKAIKTNLDIVYKRVSNIFYRYDLIFKFTPAARKQNKALNIINSFSEEIIIRRREELIESLQEGKAVEDDVGMKLKSTFLDILLQSEVDGKPLNNEDIREETSTFMFGGHDTSASALLFFFYNMTMYPECQQKCFEEIFSIFGKNGSTPVTIENLNKLLYIEMCIKETMRLYPTVAIFARKATQECEINGKLIPAGTNIGVCPLYLGRREDLFPQAELFKPERFDVNAEKLKSYSFIPFSAGPRKCVGQKFAMLEMKSVILNILRQFIVEYSGDFSRKPVLTGDFILGSRHPLMFKIKPREI